MLRAIIWVKGGGVNPEDLLPSSYSQYVSLSIAKSYEHLESLLQGSASWEVLFTSFELSDIETLYRIKLVQQTYPALSIVAVFDSNAKSAIEQALSLLIKNAETTNEESVANEPQQTPVNLKSVDLNEFNSIARCHLTPRQRDVLQMIMNGKSNKEIARSLGLSEGTVKVHCMAIFKELDVTNRTQAAMRAEHYIRSA